MPGTMFAAAVSIRNIPHCERLRGDYLEGKLPSEQPVYCYSQSGEIAAPQIGRSNSKNGLFVIGQSEPMTGSRSKSTLQSLGVKMYAAKPGDTVRVQYTGRLKDGRTIDSCHQDSPLEITLGTGDLIRGLEQAVVGMAAGESKLVVIPASDAYGARDDVKVLRFLRSELPDNMEPRVGQQTRVRMTDGSTLTAIVTDVNKSSFTVKAYHSLAGEDLAFDLELVEIV